MFSFQIVISSLLIKLLSNLTHKKENNGVKRGWEGSQAWNISFRLPPHSGPDLCTQHKKEEREAYATLLTYSLENV